MRCLIEFLLIATLTSAVSSLECYVCSEQEENIGKCGKAIQICDYEDDVCMTQIRWGSTPYWSQGSDKQYYVTKSCSNATTCERSRVASLHRCHRIWYEDWECTECCKGDRCNYYITLGASGMAASIALVLSGLLVAILGRMYGDLVCALLGVPGAFYNVKGEGTEVFVEPRVLDVLSSNADSVLIEKICGIATSYCRLLRFIKKFSDFRRRGDEKYTDYYQVLAEGFRRLTKPYRLTVAKLEEEISSGPGSLMNFWYALEQFDPVLKAFNYLCFELENLQVPGSCVLNVLDKHSNKGVPFLKEACLELMKECRMPFLRHFASWVLLGVSQKRENDFFITGGNEDELGFASVTLNPQQLPVFISVRLANLILNLSKSVLLLRMFGGSQNSDLWQKVSEKHPEVLRKLKELNEEPDEIVFKRNFQTLVEEIGANIDKQMAKMILEDGKLVESCLLVIKNHFLMGQGDLHTALVASITKLYSTRRQQKDETKIQPRINECVRDELEACNLEKFPNGIRVVSREPCSFTLEFDIGLPCNLVVSEALIATKYRPIYEFLVRVRKAQIGLLSLSCRRMKLKVMPRGDKAREACLLMEMLFVVRHVLSFADWFIEEKFAELLAGIKAEKTALDQIRGLHETFAFEVGALINSIFLKAMKKVLDACDNYCALLMDSQDGYTDESDAHKCFLVEAAFKQGVVAVMQFTLVAHRKEVATSLKELTRQLCANPHMLAKYIPSSYEEDGIEIRSLLGRI
ncbi:unnamed protein product [Notodromas monacha]|uniref:Gamma-tubulin complex component n=1 Tax=Notodromas monacha TaxID=399045 RepID=A0A7R9GFT3_9CRUS|nr:unnamed protein product [Notodromas monacha]CAG0919673.1 unnamed protein product [Notodromas monacha]